LAEGVFEERPDRNLQEHVEAADEAYWASFIDSRRETIKSTAALLRANLEAEVVTARAVHAAVTSLDHAADQLTSIRPAHCADYLHAWLDDQREWGSATARVNTVASDSVISRELALPDWHSNGMEPPRSRPISSPPPERGRSIAAGAPRREPSRRRAA
jgi:hypothetical protein